MAVRDGPTGTAGAGSTDAAVSSADVPANAATDAISGMGNWLNGETYSAGVQTNNSRQGFVDPEKRSSAIRAAAQSSKGRGRPDGFDYIIKKLLNKLFNGRDHRTIIGLLRNFLDVLNILDHPVLVHDKNRPRQQTQLLDEYTVSLAERRLAMI